MSGDKLRTCNLQKISDSKAMPYVGIRLSMLTRKSLGGIATDLLSRVLDVKGDPMPGLYAVGEASGFGGGGIHGKRALEGTFLGACVFSARSRNNVASKYSNGIVTTPSRTPLPNSTGMSPRNRASRRLRSML